MQSFLHIQMSTSPNVYFSIFSDFQNLKRSKIKIIQNYKCLICHLCLNFKLPNFANILDVVAHVPKIKFIQLVQILSCRTCSNFQVFHTQHNCQHTNSKFPFPNFQVCTFAGAFVLKALKGLLEGLWRPLKAHEVLVMSASDFACLVKISYLFFSDFVSLFHAWNKLGVDTKPGNLEGDSGWDIR